MNNRVSRRYKKHSKVPLFILVALIFIVIGLIATTFSFFIKNDKLNNVGMSSLLNNSKGVSSVPPLQAVASSGSVTSTVPPSSIASDSASSDMSSAPLDTEKYVLVPKSEAVERAYFDDAVFIGDSISKGLKLYGVLPPENVLADQNVGIDQIANDKEVYSMPGGVKMTLFNALKTLKTKPKKIYIMLGSNGLPHYDNAKHLEYYEKVLDRIIKEYPDTIIYLQSVTPITTAAEKTYKARGKDFTNAKINSFNKGVLALATKKEVYYLQVRDALVDKNGCLSAEYEGGDGVHFKKSGHESMYSYYKTHTVK